MSPKIKKSNDCSILGIHFEYRISMYIDASTMHLYFAFIFSKNSITVVNYVGLLLSVGELA